MNEVTGSKYQTHHKKVELPCIPRSVVRPSGGADTVADGADADGRPDGEPSHPIGRTTLPGH